MADAGGEGAPGGRAPRDGSTWLALAVMIALAGFVYGEAFASRGTRVVGSPETETYSFLWGYHWAADTLLGKGRWPYWTNLLGYPDGGVLWLKEPLAVAAFAPLLPYIGIPLAFQLTQAVHSVAGGMALFALARRLGASPAPALLAGLCFGFSPHVLGEAYNGNLEAMNIAWLPLWCLAVHYALSTGRLRAVPVVAGALFVMAVANQYYTIAMGLVTGPVALAALWHTHGGPGRRWLRPIAVLLVGALLGLAAFAPIGAKIVESLDRQHALTNAHAGVVPRQLPYLSDIEQFWKPGDPPRRSNEPHLPPFRDHIYVGLGLVFLGLLAPLVGRPRGAWHLLWPLLGAGLSVLSLGPLLFVDGHIVRTPEGVVALPWYYLVEGKPLLGKMTLPHRMAVPAGLCWAMALSLTLEGLRRRARLGHPLGVILGAAVVVEMLVLPPGTLPLESMPLPRPAHARLLAALDAPGAVINLPMAAPAERPRNALRIYFWYQTLHGRPVESRMTGQWPRVVLSTPFLFNEIRPLLTHRPDLSTPARPLHDDPTGLINLRLKGFGFFVLHLGLLGEDNETDVERWQAVLTPALGAGLVLADGTVVFALDPAVRARLAEDAARVLAPGEVLGASEDFVSLLPAPEGGAGETAVDRGP